MQVTVSRLFIAPALVVSAVFSTTVSFGDHPVTWTGVTGAVQRAAAALLPGADLPGLAPETWDGPVAAPPAEGGPAPAVPPRYPVRPVAQRWTPGTAQTGVQIYWESSPADDEDVVWAKAQRIVDYVTGLGANAVVVSFPFYTTGMTASSVSTGPRTPSPHRIEILAHEAALAGLRVTVRPILNEASLEPVGGWRGSIRPDDPAAWFSSYRDLLAPYLAAAQRQQVETFTLGTELNSLEPRADWAELTAWAGRAFGGELSYDLNYDNYGRGLYPSGPQRFGVDAYVRLTATDTPTSADVAAVWNGWFDTLPATAPRGVVLTEVGIGARRGAYRNPGDGTDHGTLDPQVQPTWYAGVCAAARAHQLGGIYFWKVDFDADPANPTQAERPTLDFIGRPASEQAIRDCLSAPWTVSTVTTPPTVPATFPSSTPSTTGHPEPPAPSPVALTPGSTTPSPGGTTAAASPTGRPSTGPTGSPSSTPSRSGTASPSVSVTSPTGGPSGSATASRSAVPTASSTGGPTGAPTTAAPPPTSAAPSPPAPTTAPAPTRAPSPTGTGG